MTWTAGLRVSSVRGPVQDNEAYGFRAEERVRVAGRGKVRLFCVGVEVRIPLGTQHLKA